MHVYVVEAPHGVKVGISRNPTARVRAIETQGGFESSRVWMSTARSDAQKIERKTHKLMNDARSVGEWFNATFDAAIDAIETAISGPLIDEAPKQITERIRLAIEVSGMSQSELARTIGVTRAAVSHWVSWKVVYIRPDHLFALSDALNVSARWIATGKTY